MTATISYFRRSTLGLCAVLGLSMLWTSGAQAKKALGDTPTNAMIVDNPMSALNPFNGGADPVTMPGDARIGVFPYSRDQIYRVLTAPLKLTTIELEKGEKLIADPAMGDSIQWEIDDDKSNHIFIKPHKA